MSTKDVGFEPSYKEVDRNDFNIWDMKIPEPVPEPTVDLKAEIEAECEQLRKEAREKGYQEGFQQAQAEIVLKKQELDEWIMYIQEPVRFIDKAVSDEIIQTILWICEACIGVELTINPEKLLTIVAEIKKELPTIRGARRLVMNPEDAEWLKDHWEAQKYAKLLSMISTDEELVRGDFYLSGEHSALDGRLKLRLQKLFASYFSTDETTEDTDFYDGLI